MSLLRLLSLVFAIGAVLGLLFGSSGMTGVVADRGVTVSIVDDEYAYVGYDASNINSNNATIEITNRFLRDLDVMVSAESTVTKNVRVGQEKDFSVEVSCTVNETSRQGVIVTTSIVETNDDFASISRVIEVPPCSTNGTSG